MIIVCIPKVRPNEQRYILDVMLGEFLGFEFDMAEHDYPYIKITMVGSAASLTINADFFHKANENWLMPESMPVLPLQCWVPTKGGIECKLINAKLPVLFGKAGLLKKDNQWCLNLDVFGSAFFMLSRYEELVTTERDEHQRFPATASIAYKAKFLERPIVDEYLETLWACMSSLWPRLERKKRQPRDLISCDIDRPYYAHSKGLIATLIEVACDILQRRSICLAFNNILRYVCFKLGYYGLEPFMVAIKWIMDVNEEVGNKVTFFFIPKQKHKTYDGCYDLSERVMKYLIQEVVRRGHEVGVHSGYQTFQNKEETELGVQRLKQAVQGEGVKQSCFGNRQHYLRWDSPVTARNLDDAGVSYDSSLGYADHPGFRCGTCHEFPMFDPVKGEMLSIRQRPLILMECSVISSLYLGMGHSNQALEYMKEIRQTCHKVGGDFTLLWHNSSLTTDADKEFYQSLISDSALGNKIYETK